MTLKVLAMQAAGGDPTISYSALDVRALLDAVLSEGVVGASALKVSQRGAGANFSVDIAAGFGAVTGDDVANQGKYLIQSTATENRTTPSPPVSGTRVHRVVAQIRDKLHNGSWSTYEVTLDVLADTGSGTPATPASAISLATVSVAAGQASVLDANITSTRPYAAAPPGGFLIAPTAADEPSGPFDGQAVWRRDLRQLKVWDASGSAYRTVNSLSAPIEAYDATDITTTSTSFVAGSPVLSRTFTAPPSGMVSVTVSGDIDNSASATTFLGYEIRNSNSGGAVVWAADPDKSFGVQETNSVYGCMRTLVTGLTPLTQTYYIQTMIKVSGGTGTYLFRRMLIEPVP